MLREPLLIVLTGPIASGKSTVGPLVVRGTRLVFCAEDVDSRPEDRDVLARYYESVARADRAFREGATNDSPIFDAARDVVFATQRHFIARRADMLRRALHDGRSAVAERHPRDDIEIFSRRNLAQGLLTAEQFDALSVELESATTGLPAPSFHVFLHASPARLRQRIQERARPQEAALVDPANRYLEELDALYASWYERCPGEKIRIVTDDLEERAIADRARTELLARGLA